MRIARLVRNAVLALVCTLASVLAHGHGASNGYLTLALDANGVRGELAVALRDLDPVLELDVDGDGAIRWSELRARHAAIAAYVVDRLQVRVDDRTCPLRTTEQLVEARDDGHHALVRIAGDCTGTTLAADYRLLFDADRQHRGLLRLETPDGTTAGVASPDEPRVVSTAASTTAGIRTTFFRFVAEGIHHIAIGFDHILFLLCLVLPVLLGRNRDEDRATTQWGPLVRVVTAFTVAHSITLALAALDVFAPAPRITEAAIAATVVGAALANLRRGRRMPVGWVLAFALGLVHGFGFASVLAGLALPAGSLVTALAGFNVGVELGQLLLVLALVPIGHAVRRWTSDGGARTLRAASLGIAAIGLFWLGERLIDVGGVA
jgi:hypothetical protein